MVPLPELVEAVEGQPLVLSLAATDPDGDRLQWRVEGLPPGAAFDSAPWLLHWIPDFDAAGTYPGVSFVVSDGTYERQTSTTLLVAPANRAPQLVRPADRAVREGDRLQLVLQGGDPDGDAVTFSSPLLPPGASLHPDTGRFDWTPGFDQAGVYQVEFVASDGRASTSVTTVWTVLNVNAAPVLDGLDRWEITEGQTLAFRVFAQDPDNPAYVPSDRNADGIVINPEGIPPTVSYAAAAACPREPPLMPETGMFLWTPGYRQAGSYEMVFTATDDGNGTGNALQTTVAVPVTVLNTNRPPEIQPIANVVVRSGDVLQLPIAASDADGNTLVLSTTSALPGFPLPSFITLIDHGDGTGTLRLAPEVGDRGDYPLIVSARDDGDGNPAGVLTGRISLVVSVESDNEPPKLDYIGDRVAVAGVPFSLTVRARDLDAEPLTFTMSGLPPSATLEPGAVYGTAVLSWIPTPNDVGTYAVAVQVTDGGNGDPARKASDSTTIAPARAHRQHGATGVTDCRRGDRRRTNAFAASARIRSGRRHDLLCGRQLARWSSIRLEDRPTHLDTRLPSCRRLLRHTAVGNRRTRRRPTDGAHHRHEHEPTSTVPAAADSVRSRGQLARVHRGGHGRRRRSAGLQRAPGSAGRREFRCQSRHVAVGTHPGAGGQLHRAAGSAGPRRPVRHAGGAICRLPIATGHPA